MARSLSVPTGWWVVYPSISTETVGNMHLGPWLDFYVSNVNAFVVWTAVGCLSLIALYLLISLRTDHVHAGLGGTQLSNLEDVLKKLMENQKSSSSAETAQAMIQEAPSGATSESELGSLKKLVNEKETLIEQLNAQLKNSKSSEAGSDELNSLRNRLKEAEGKLSEYQIIEDDIANLSLYKEENVKLKDELDRLKTSGAKVPEVAPAPTGATSPGEDLSGENLLKEFEAAASQVEVKTDVQLPDLSIPVPESEQTLMKEFENAIKKHGVDEGPSGEKELSRAIQDDPNKNFLGTFQEAVKVEEASTQTVASTESSTLIPETGAGVAAAEKPVLSVVSSPTETPSVSSAIPEAKAEQVALPSALNESIDTDQMVSELANFTPSTVAAAAEPVDEGEKLISEFENFVSSQE